MCSPTKFVILGVLVVALLFAERSYGKLEKPEIIIVIQNVTYEINPEYLTIDIKIRNDSDGVSVIDVESDLLKDLNMPIFLSLDVQTKLPEVDEYQSLITSQGIDVCRFIQQSSETTILKMLHQNIDKYGNLLLKKCPIVKDHYYLRGFQIDTNILPSFTPPGYYRFNISLVAKPDGNNITLYDMAWYARVLKE